MQKFLKQIMTGSDTCFQMDGAVSSWKAAMQRETSEKKGDIKIIVKDLHVDCASERQRRAGLKE